MKTIITIKPTQIIRPFGDKSPVEVRIFGQNGGETNWSIKHIQKNADLRDNENPQVATYHAIENAVMEATGTTCYTLYAPSPDFSGRIADLKEFEHKGVELLGPERPESSNGTRLLLARGVSADGCEIPAGKGFWLSSADCPTLIVTDGKRVVCAHCGYKSLVDVGALNEEKSSRQHYSVVDAVIDNFKKAGVKPDQLKAFIALGIRKHFDEACVPRNKKGGRKPLLDIVDLVRRQCLSRGIVRVKTDNNDTYADRNRRGQELWWSYQRAKELNLPDEMLKRNGVMVVHHSR